jgi:hypothetical protein
MHILRTAQFKKVFALPKVKKGTGKKATITTESDG